MSDKKKFPRADALAVAKELCDLLEPHVEKLIVAGSLRRRKKLVGDVEILYVPKIIEVKPDNDWFANPQPRNMVDHFLGKLLLGGTIEPRLNSLGRQMWGPSNKLGLHVKSGIPIDLFQTSHSAWWNYLVCRTGGAESNVAICTAAQRKGWKWNPTKDGFTNRVGDMIPVNSEREVFELIGLLYKEPWERL